MENEQKKNGGKKALTSFLFLGICFLLGILLGSMLSGAANKEQFDKPFLPYMLGVLANVLLLFLAVYLQFILHEGGHYVFGRLTGYRLISFRVGSLTWVKTNDGIKRKRMKLTGTGGQCLMSPPAWNDGNFPYKLFNLGGSLMNLISAVLFLLVYLAGKDVPFLSFFCLSMVFIGVAIGLMNGIPLRIGGVNNDGYNALSLGKDKTARWAFWTQLRCSAELSLGKRLIEMPPEWFDLPEGDWQNNALSATIAVFRENLFMDAQQFDKAAEMLALLLDTPNQLAPLYKNMLTCDRMYLEMLGECREEVLSKLDTKEFQAFRKSMKDYLTILRTEYALTLLRDKDADKARKVMEHFEKCSQSHPYPGESISERQLMELAKEKAGL